MHEVVGYRSVQDGRGIKFLPGNRRPHHGEDAGADHGANAGPDQRPRAQCLLKPMFRLLRIGDEFVDGLAREDLVRQVTLPGVLELMPSNSNRKNRVRASQRRSPRGHRDFLIQPSTFREHDLVLDCGTENSKRPPLS